MSGRTSSPPNSLSSQLWSFQLASLLGSKWLVRRIGRHDLLATLSTFSVLPLRTCTCVYLWSSFAVCMSLDLVATLSTLCVLPVLYLWTFNRTCTWVYLCHCRCAGHLLQYDILCRTLDFLHIVWESQWGYLLHASCRNESNHVNASSHPNPSVSHRWGQIKPSKPIWFRASELAS